MDFKKILISKNFYYWFVFIVMGVLFFIFPNITQANDLSFYFSVLSLSSFIIYLLIFLIQNIILELITTYLFIKSYSLPWKKFLKTVIIANLISYPIFCLLYYATIVSEYINSSPPGYYDYSGLFFNFLYFLGNKIIYFIPGTLFVLILEILVIIFEGWFIYFRSYNKINKKKAISLSILNNFYSAITSTIMVIFLMTIANNFNLSNIQEFIYSFWPMIFIFFIPLIISFLTLIFSYFFEKNILPSFRMKLFKKYYNTLFNNCIIHKFILFDVFIIPFIFWGTYLSILNQHPWLIFLIFLIILLFSRFIFVERNIKDLRNHYRNHQLIFIMSDFITSIISLLSLYIIICIIICIIIIFGTVFSILLNKVIII